MTSFINSINFWPEIGSNFLTHARAPSQMYWFSLLIAMLAY